MRQERVILNPLHEQVFLWVINFCYISKNLEWIEQSIYLSFDKKYYRMKTLYSEQKSEK